MIEFTNDELDEIDYLSIRQNGGEGDFSVVAVMYDDEEVVIFRDCFTVGAAKADIARQPEYKGIVVQRD